MLTLNAKIRTEVGKGPGRRLRAQGLLPAVIYGCEKETKSLQIDAKELAHLLHTEGTNSIIDLGVEGEVEKVMVHGLQREPIHNQLVHVDFLRIRMDRPINTIFKVLYEGVPEGVRQGGVLERPARELEIQCLPSDIPSEIRIDVSQLNIGDVLNAGEVDLGDKIRLITDPATTLFHVVIPRAVEEEPVEGEEGEEEAVEGEESVEGEKAEKE